MKYLNPLFSLIVFLLFSTFAVSQNLIEVHTDGVAKLTQSQLTNYQKIMAKKFSSEAEIISIGDLPSIQSNGELEFRLPGKDCLVKSKAIKVQHTDGNNYTWSGRVLQNPQIECGDCEEGSFILIKKKGKFIGFLSLYEDEYTIEDLGGNKQVLVKINFGEEEVYYCGEDHVYPESLATENNDVKSNGDNCPVKVLVVFTTSAANVLNDVQLAAELAIAKIESGFFRSEMTSKVKLVGVTNVTFTEGGSMTSDVAALAASTTINTLRDDFFADIVVLLTDGNNYGSSNGIVAAIGPVDGTSYAIVQAETINETYVFAHEVGHLFGARHHRDHDGLGPLYGHAWKVKGKRTILWRKANKNLGLYSNPNVSYCNKPAGHKFYANNSKLIDENNCIVSSFRNNENVSLSGFISGPSSSCPNEDIPVNVVASGGQVGNYQYAWSYSLDGFNFTTISSSAYSVQIPSIDLPPSNQEIVVIFIKATVSDSNSTIELFKTVSVSFQDLGQDPPCDH